MKSIKSKLIVSVASIVFIALLMSNIVSHFMLVDTYEKEVQLKHKNLGNAIITNVQSFIEKAYAVSEQMATSPSIYNFNPIEQTALSVTAKQNNSYFDLVFIQDLNGMQTARSAGNLGNRSERWWFKKIISEKKPFVSKSYYSLSGNVPVTSVFIPIYDESKSLKGILGTDIRLNILQDVVEKFSSETAYAFIIDGQGTLVAHPDKEKVAQLYNYYSLSKTVLVTNTNGKVKLNDKGNQITEEVKFKISDDFSKIVQDVLSGKSGFKEFNNTEGESVFSYYNHIPLPGTSDDWAIITIEKASDAHILKNQTLYIHLILALISIAVIVFFLMIIASQIVGRINSVASSLNDLSEGEGDLTRRLIVEADDEIGELSRLFNSFLGRLQSIINEVKSNSDVVALNSSDLAELSTKISTSMFQQNDQISNVADATLKISNSCEGIDRSIADGISNIEVTNDSIREGNDQLDLVMSEMSYISNDIHELKRTIESLSESSIAIGDIISVINDIASQTNLLALNAAIEAARAGEQGRGFSVVADEVRLLAEKTQTSTQEVDSIINVIQTSAARASEDMNSAFSRFETGVKNVNDTKDYFEKIVQSIKQLSSVIYSIKSTIEEQNQEIQSINENTQHISNSADKSSQSLSTMSNTSNDLGTQAENLKTVVDQFRTN